MYGFESDYFLRMRCDLMKKKWLEPAVEQGMIDTFSQNLGISPILARILYNRGIHDLQEADHFLHDTSDDLYESFFDERYEKSCRTDCRSLREKRKDCHLRRLRCRWHYIDIVIIFCPSRLRRYAGTTIFRGGTRKAMASMKRLWKAWPKRRQTLLITVDCGIASHDLVQAFKDRMTIIVTDHHTPPDPLPPAYAILNPKQPGCPYPFKESGRRRRSL